MHAMAHDGTRIRPSSEVNDLFTVTAGPQPRFTSEQHDNPKKVTCQASSASNAAFDTEDWYFFDLTSTSKKGNIPT